MGENRYEIKRSANDIYRIFDTKDQKFLGLNDIVERLNQYDQKKFKK